ncbi:MULTISPECIES: YrzQ family protein [Bacillus]|uniref:YrzQ family protein n=1 Tax=Bacillus TaxID=1386 RepID=UPI000BB87D8B|nr:MULTISPECIES: YrzQ family protein [Bacillus]
MNKTMTSLLLIGIGAAASQMNRNGQVKDFFGDLTSTRNMKKMRKQAKKMFS